MKAKPPGKLIPPPLGCFKLRDPHPSRPFWWTYWRGQFWQRAVDGHRWQAVERVHITAKRAEMFATLARSECLASRGR